MFEQERFIGRLQRYVLGMSPILVCFLYGSFGRRAEDPYSDIDVMLVYGGAAEREPAWAGREEFVRAVMPYVAARSYDATHLHPYLHLALYSNGTKADFRLETLDELNPAPEFREIRILKDHERRAEALQAASARLAPPQPDISPKELEELDSRFWVRYWNAFRILLRNEPDRAFPYYLRLLHSTIPPLLEALPPEDPACRELMQVLYTGDAKATLSSMLELLDGYVTARSAVIRRQSMAFPINSAFENEIRRLIIRHAS
jgi:hypothetical protein